MFKKRDLEIQKDRRLWQRKGKGKGRKRKEKEKEAIIDADSKKDVKKKSKDPAVVWDGKPSSISEQNEMWQNFQSEIDSLFDKSGSPSSLSSKSKSTMETKDIQQKLQREDYKGEGMTEVCLECLQDTLIEGASGCYECTSCGVIGNQIIDTGAEWRFYGSEDNKSSDPTRCGMPSNELLPQSSLGSVVGYGWKGDTFEMHRIRKYQGWNAMPYKERARYNDFQIIQQTAARGDYHSVLLKTLKVNTRKLRKIRFQGC